jgi:hypothetical protein
MTVDHLTARVERTLVWTSQPFDDDDDELLVLKTLSR